MNAIVHMGLVDLSYCGRVLRVHLNSPKNLNALSSEMIRTLHDAFDSRQVKKASVVLLTSAGRHFGAGHDLSEMAGGCGNPALFRQCSDLMQRVAMCEVPVVAAVQGCAFAAGCQLAASCDIVVAAKDARFATPGAKIGLFCSTPSVALTRAANAKVAADMLFSARELSADEALQAGLVSRVLPVSATLQEEALQLCHKIAEAPREMLVNGKALLLAQRAQPLASAYELASTAMETGLNGDFAPEGISAFLEKRRPVWKSEEQEIEMVVSLAKNGIAVVGASPDPSRPSHDVLTSLKQSCPVFPVNPSVGEVAGDRCFKDLAAVDSAFAVVNVFRAGPSAADAIDETIALAAKRPEIKAVWLQKGVRAPEAEARAREAGLFCVADKCLKVEVNRREAGRSPPAARL